MIDAGSWRDAGRYRSIVVGGRAALAWELLRRDDRYRREYRSARDDALSRSAAGAAWAGRWGLHFRG